MTVVPPDRRLLGLIGASEVLRFAGDPAARPLKEEVIELARRLGEDRWVAAMLNDLTGMGVAEKDLGRQSS